MVYDSEFFFNATQKEASLFENFAPKSYDDLLTALKLADERIIKKIAMTGDTWTRKRLNEVKRLIEEEISKAFVAFPTALQEDSIDVAKVVLASTLGMTGQLPKSVLDDLLNNNRDIQGYSFNELFKLDSENHARQLRVLLASGVRAGWSADKIIREFGLKSEKLTRGQLQNDIFTTIADSRDQGRYAGYRQLEKTGVIKGYVYDATLDSNTTLYCREHDQRVYNKSINEIQGEIKVHFHCRSVFRPATVTDQSGKRPTKSGEVPFNETYETWFKKQSKAFQKSTLTNRRYKEFLDGKYKIKSVVDLDKTTDIKTIKNELLK
jgi:hypothetical protein